MHKTGTTWLQERLFVPEFGYAPVLDHQGAWELMLQPHALAFDPVPARARIARAIEHARDGLAPVVSSELFCGMPFRGSRESAEFARRIKAVCPDARILVTIRAQVPIIAATYMQYVRRGGTRSPRRFYAHHPTPGYNQFDAGHFQYDRLVAHYQALFGQENVQVMTHELLIADPARFVNELGAWAGAEAGGRLPDTGRVGVSDPEPALPLLRLINHFRFDDATDWPLLDCGRTGRSAYQFASWLFRRPALGRLLNRSRPATRSAKELFSGSFAESNRRLRELCGPSLELPGYEA